MKIVTFPGYGQVYEVVKNKLEDVSVAVPPSTAVPERIRLRQAKLKNVPDKETLQMLSTSKVMFGTLKCCTGKVVILLIEK